MKILLIILIIFLPSLTCFGQTWDLNAAQEPAEITYTGAIVTIEIVNLSEGQKVKIDGFETEIDFSCSSKKMSLSFPQGKYFVKYCDNQNKSGNMASDLLTFKIISSDGTDTKKRLNIRNNSTPGNDPVVSKEMRPFFDAIILKDRNANAIDSVIKKYQLKPGSANPFLNDLSLNSSVSFSPSDLASTAISSLGGLDVTKFADGLAKFLVKRAKEELTAAFFSKFREELDKHPDVKTLFPKTEASLQLIGDQIYDYERYINTLRENFQSDFEALPENFPGIIENHDAYFKKNPKLRSGVEVGSTVAIGLRDREHPGTIIKSITAKNLDGWQPDVKNSFFIVQTFSEALRDTVTGENARYWIGKEEFAKMTADTVLLRYFIGLSLEMVKGKDTSLYTTLIQEKYTTPFWKTLKGVNEQSLRLNTLIKNNKGEKLSLETATSYVDAVTKLLGTVGEAVQLVKPNTPKVDFIRQTFIPFVQNGNSLVANISKKQYGSALFNVIELYKLTKPEELGAFKKFDELGEALKILLIKQDKEKWANADLYKLFIDLSRLTANSRNTIYNPSNDVVLRNAIENFTKADFPTSTSALEWLTKYGGFMAAMISAETSDELAAVIETYALPSGSARIKRQSKFNIALNAYLGLYGGVDNLKKIDKNNWEERAIFGLSAPVGVAFSKGWKNVGSFTLFPTLIDIGAITAFRFKNDTSQVAKIYLKEIFSPGLFFSYGIPKWPISINLGSLYAPLLQRVGTETNIYDINRKWRHSISILVDIPLLNLYNREK